MSNINTFEKYIKQINRINRIRHILRTWVPVVALVVLAACISGRVYYNRGLESGAAAAVQGIYHCESEGASGYYTGDQGQIVCIYD